MKVKNTIFSLISLAIIGIGYAMSNSVYFGLCIQNQYSCREVFNRIGDPMFYGGLGLFVVFLALYFVPKAWSAWKKFALWFIPLALLLFIFYPEPGSGDFFSPYPQTVFKWVSAIYVAISLYIILLTLRNPKK